MGKIKDKILDWKNRLRDRKMLSLVVCLTLLLITLAVYAFKLSQQFARLTENTYNFAFYQLVEYSNNLEKLLQKAQITNSIEHHAESFASITRETSLAKNTLARLPIKTQELEKTQKFLSQLEDYSYSLTKKTISGEELSEDDYKKVEELYNYSKELVNTLNQLETDFFSQKIEWGAIEKNAGKELSEDEYNDSQSSFANIEGNLQEYTGLIYDGAYSDHITNVEKVGLTGDEIDENSAETKAKQFVDEDNIKEIIRNGEIKDGDIDCYSFSIKTLSDEIIDISISKKGGHTVFMNANREVYDENISKDEAVNIAKTFLEKRDFANMKETYYMDTNNIQTINFAYEQNGIIMYPDLIKVKVAMDNGEVLGIESTGYLNSHNENRNITEPKITEEQARAQIRDNYEITSCNLVIIPTEWKTEILCWEIKGKTDENEFLVYIDAKTGKEENILMIVDTPNGTLTA